MDPAPDFQTLFQATPCCCLVLSPDLRILGVTDSYLAATMTERAAILGRPLFEVFPDNPDDPLVDGVANLRASLERVLATRLPDRMAIQKYDIRRPESEGGGFEERYWSPFNKPVLSAAGEVTYIINCAEDVTDILRLRAQGDRQNDAAKLLSERLTSAVQSMQDAFALFDRDNRLVLCNPAYRELIGSSPSESLTGKTFKELLEAWLDRMEFANDAARDHFRSERLDRPLSEASRATDIRLRDGRSLRIIDRRTPEGGMVKTIWDLTEDMRLAEELRSARIAAEAASRAKSEFLASMSHELRTPLNAILGFAQLLQRDKKEPVSPRHLQRIDQIVQGGEHLLRLIDDILDLSRIESGRISISIEPVLLADILVEVRDTLEGMASRQQIALTLDPTIAGHRVVSADRVRLAQVLINFGSNAIKYNRPHGSVKFGVSAPEPGRVRVSVSDTGLGIAAGKQASLFQPFQRAGQEQGPIEGTGIGLVIAQRLAASMGAKLGFRSTEGDGSEFWIDLQASELPAVRAPVALSEPAASSTPLHAQRRVLYVEDNPANIAFMADLIDQLDDVDLATTRTAEEGVQLAQTLRPDAILMDINLPGMSGLDALKVLRATAETRAIPVIALTAAASEREKVAGVRAGFYRYLTKPLQIDELLDALHAALENPPARDPPPEPGKLLI